MISKAEIAKKVREWGIRFDIAEKDFCIGWLLKGIADEVSFKKHFVFKGGTALKKCYFPEHRFSEDLDFTVIEGFDWNLMRSQFERVCSRVSDESGCEFQLLGLDQRREIPKEEAFEVKICFRGPSQPQNLKPIIKVDLTFYERVVLPPQTRPIFHPYSDGFQADVLCYCLEEILAEKLRAILQQRSRVPRPRDFYDVRILLRAHSDKLSLAQIREVFLEKCEFKKVPFHSIEDLFDPDLLQRNEGAWKSSIGKQVRELESFAEVIQELRISLAAVCK